MEHAVSRSRHSCYRPSLLGLLRGATDRTLLMLAARFVQEVGDAGFPCSGCYKELAWLEVRM